MLSQEISQLTKEVAELDAAVTEAVDMRAAEKKQKTTTLTCAISFAASIFLIYIFFIYFSGGKI